MDKYKIYEAEKKKIPKNLSGKEYEDRLKALAEKLKL